MSFRKPSRRQMLSSCADLGPEDGLDPRDFFRKSPAKVTNRKALQLCAQVAEVLGFVLSGCGDPVVRDLVVQSVRPAPTSARLLVSLAAAPCASEAIDPATALQHLRNAAGLLRTEVAVSIHRRYAPELTFRVLTS